MAETHRDPVKEAMQEQIDILERENNELREQRHIDNMRMQNEICDLKMRMAAVNIPMVAHTMGTNPFPVQVKKEPLEETSPCRTPLVERNSAKEEQLFNFFESQPASKQSDYKPSTKVKAATFDGTSSWLDYKAHFETCAEINNWSYGDKGLYLAVALRGQAQGVMGNLSTKSKDYDALVQALEERFAPPNQTELYRVQLR